MQRSETDLQGEYENAVKQGHLLITKIKPVELGKQSIQDIHYWYRYAADLLIQMGTPKHKIVGKLYEDFNQFYGINWIYDILKEGGITLPKEESLVNQNNISSLNTYEQENEEEITIADELETLIHLLKEKYRTGHWASLLDPKERKENNILKRGLITMANNVLDERQLIPIPTQNIFIHCAIEFTLQDAYEKYQTIVKDAMKKLTADSKIRGIRTIEKMSSKQAHRTAFLEIKELHESATPASVNEARMKGFSGQRCPNKDPKKHPNDEDRLRCSRLPDASEGRWYECLRCDHQFEGVNEDVYTGHGIVMDESYSTHSSKTERSEGVGEL